jgi:hypothetical protein
MTDLRGRKFEWLALPNPIWAAWWEDDMYKHIVAAQMTEMKSGIS